ncbi:alcohol oxidase [Schizopora paradoxa]|uniref:Alcohol oxidase n=1 Tax=Schizopora paradoxa TaxID=27342 RepID=A0A0H2RCI7_9AGAM|nr:alcohol oxidase [Schizopora paradoxa]
MLTFKAALGALALAANAKAFDYVVIGGGTAGLAVASRLSEDPSVTVAVVEAGPNAEHLPEVFIPGLVGMGISLTTLDWQYQTVPQKNFNSRIITMNAGKVLGGSSTINAMVFPRAEKQQYDVWGALNNDSSWTWDGLLPFFKNTELSTPPNDFQTNAGVRFDPSVHGFSGRVHVGFPNFFFEQAQLWEKTVEGLGFEMSPDLGNGDPHAVGIAPNSINAANNTRCSAVCAYVTPFTNRTNFNVITNATVSRIIWSNDTSSSGGLVQASQVEYILTNGSTVQIPVGREVIVSAGTVGTPKVLELSGIGNATILRNAGVETRVNLSTVGENLADHVHSWVNSFTTFNLTQDLFAEPSFLAEQEALWFKNRTGLLSAIASSLSIIAPSNLFNKSELDELIEQSRANLTATARSFSNGNPDLANGIAAQFEHALSLYSQNKQLPLELNLGPSYAGPSLASQRPNRTYTTIGTVLYAPLSRGRTHITSSSPFAPPALDPNYYAHPLDVTMHIAGMRLARRMLTSPPLNATFLGEFEPGAEKVTDDQLISWMRANATTDQHETGTASMMPRELGGVVDTNLKVYGTQNVRVADASIIPFPVSAHMSSTVYAIGEKAASIIKSEN